LTGLIYDDVRKLIALGLIRSTTELDGSPRTPDQDPIEAFLELTPKGRQFMQRTPFTTA
jgi:hypothetical protein